MSVTGCDDLTMAFFVVVAVFFSCLSLFLAFFCLSSSEISNDFSTTRLDF
jgi:hypothetical protein